MAYERSISNSKVSIILVVLEAGKTYPSSSSYLSMSALGFEMCYVYSGARRRSFLYPSAKVFDNPEDQSTVVYQQLTAHLERIDSTTMSKTVQIGSKSQFDTLLQSSKIVVTDCKQAC